MNLAQKITALRKQLNISQKELAERLGVHKNHVNRYENGVSSPSIEALKKMAITFGVPTDYFLFDETDSMAQTRIHDQSLLNRFEKVEDMNQQDKEAIIIILDGMIIKNQIKKTIGPELEGSWKAEVRESLAEMRKGSKGYKEKDIFKIVNEAVSESRSQKATRPLAQPHHAKKAAGGSRY